jgi:hypothetical protein
MAGDRRARRGLSGKGLSGKGDKGHTVLLILPPLWRDYFPFFKEIWRSGCRLAPVVRNRLLVGLANPVKLRAAVTVLPYFSHISEKRMNNLLDHSIFAWLLCITYLCSLCCAATK